MIRRDLSTRDVYLLRCALDQFAEGEWFEAAAVAAHEWREVTKAEDRDKLSELQAKFNPAIGWGLTAARLARDGLLRRQWHEGMWMYQLTPVGHEALKLHDAVAAGLITPAVNTDAGETTTSGGGPDDQGEVARVRHGPNYHDSRGRFTSRSLDRVLGTDAQELGGSTHVERPDAGGCTS